MSQTVGELYPERFQICHGWNRLQALGKECVPLFACRKGVFREENLCLAQRCIVNEKMD